MISVAQWFSLQIRQNLDVFRKTKESTCIRVIIQTFIRSVIYQWIYRREWYIYVIHSTAERYEWSRCWEAAGESLVHWRERHWSLSWTIQGGWRQTTATLGSSLMVPTSYLDNPTNLDTIHIHISYYIHKALGRTENAKTQWLLWRDRVFSKGQ